MTLPPDIERYVERRSSWRPYVRKGADWVQIRDLNRPLPDDA